LLRRQNRRFRRFSQGNLDEPEAAIIPDASRRPSAEYGNRLGQFLDRERLQRMLDSGRCLCHCVSLSVTG
jgi:hypothetical protein